MSRVILHIGTHKTATTLIQNAFAANRKLLARRGVIYPEIGRATGHHSLLTRWLNLDPYYHTATAPLALWQGLARYAKGDTTLVLSSEEFSRGANKRVDFGEVRELLAPFDRIEVVCFLRDQVSFLQSIQLEMGKKRAAPGFPTLLEAARKTGYASGLYLDYGALYDQLLTAFPPEAIRFVDYAQARGTAGGILGTMLDLCGAGLDPADLATPALTPATAAGANISPDPIPAWAAGIVSAPEAAPDKLIAQARTALEREFGEGRSSTVYTRAEHKRMAAHVAPLNAAFEARVQAVQPEFTLSPPAPADAGADAGMIWRENIGPGFWAKFARILYNE